MVIVLVFTLFRVVDRKISNHATRDKLFLNKRSRILHALLAGQLAGKSEYEFSSDLGVFPFLSHLRLVPKRPSIPSPAWRVIGG